MVAFARGWRLGVAAVGAPLGFAGLLATQAARARRRAYLPPDPGYRVDAVLRAQEGGGVGVAPLRLVMLGDSTVAGVGSESATGSLAVLVGQRLARLTRRDVHVTGLGVSGARTRDLAGGQLPAAAALAPDVVVAVVGSNDVTHVTPPWTLRRELERLVAGARSATPAPIVLAGIPRFARMRILGQPLSTVTDAYATVLRAVQRRVAASSGVPFVEIARDASPRFRGEPEALSLDGFHPGPVGYGFWADAIAPVVAGALPVAGAR